jgi:hypothetical protein
MYSGVGSFEIVILATDNTGSTNSHSLYLTVNPATDTFPVITLLGDNPQNITLGSAYVELGASASDLEDGDLTSSIIVDSSNVDVNLVGAYSVTYSVRDSHNNLASETRTVQVIDPAVDEAPVITLLGGSLMFSYLGLPYHDNGAVAYDDIDGDLTSLIVMDDSAVDTNTLGEYNVTFNVQDSSGNDAVEVIRTVRIITLPVNTPVISILGDNAVEVELGSVYVDAGAVAYDNDDGDLTSSIVVESTVNTSALGNYAVFYNVNDSDGNAAAEKIRLVAVVENSTPIDNDAPTISIIFPKSKTYIDRKIFFKVSVDEDADVKFSLDGDSNVTMDKIADYVFTYRKRMSYGYHDLIFYATDDAGNVGSAQVFFRVKRKTSPKRDDPISSINLYEYLENKTVEEIILPQTKKSSPLGWIIILLLGIGILIILLLIILIKRDKEERVKNIYDSVDELY